MTSKFRVIGFWRAAAGRFLIMSLLWWSLVEGDLKSWYVAAVAIIAADIASLMLLPVSSTSPYGHLMPVRQATSERKLPESTLGGIN